MKALNIDWIKAEATGHSDRFLIGQRGQRFMPKRLGESAWSGNQVRNPVEAGERHDLPKPVFQ